MAKHIQGLDKLDDAIKKLSQKDAKKAANKAVRAGLAPIRKQAKQNAKKLDDPATAENISKNIAIRSMKSRDAGPDTKGARLGVLGARKHPLQRPVSLLVPVKPIPAVIHTIGDFWSLARKRCQHNPSCGQPWRKVKTRLFKRRRTSWRRKFSSSSHIAGG